MTRAIRYRCNPFDAPGNSPLPAYGRPPAAREYRHFSDAGRFVVFALCWPARWAEEAGSPHSCRSSEPDSGSLACGLYVIRNESLEKRR
jgi:hypothetical protein